MVTGVLLISPFLDLNILDCLSEEEKKRQNLINELYQTEEAYVDNLKLVYEVFIKNIRAPGQWLASKAVTKQSPSFLVSPTSIVVIKDSLTFSLAMTSLLVIELQTILCLHDLDRPL